MKHALIALMAALTAAATHAQPNPIAWFDMKEVSGSTVTDVSGNGRNLTLGPTVSVVDDDFVGKALKVCGQKTDWATFSCPVVTNATIAFWMKRDAADSTITGPYPYVMGSSFSGYAINYTKNAAGLTLIDQWDKPTATGTQLTFNSTDVPREVWHHVTITVSRTMAEDGASATFTSTTYVDGIVRQTSSRTAVVVHPRAMTTVKAVLLNNGQGGDRPTSGLFADFRFYSECLTADEVAELCLGLGGKRLVVRYPFDEISTPASEAERMTTPATTPNTDALTLGSNMVLVADGVDGKALRFMGSTEVGCRAYLPCMPLKEHTMAVWLRQSTQRTNMNASVRNPYPRLFNGLNNGSGGYAQFSDSASLGRSFSYVPSGYGTTSKATYDYAVADNETWSHLAIVERLVEGDEAVADIYVNGKLAKAGTTRFTLETIPSGHGYWIGNSDSYTSARWFCGDMDDFRIYNYALTSNEVRRLAHGLAKISAGDDFTVAGTKGVLQGTTANSADDGLRTGFAGTLAWSLVSVPSGGEGATILQPAAAETEVTLPVAGEYVFRLTISDLGVSKSDDVTVTCVATDAGNAAPTISAVASGAVTRPDGATLTATVSDDDLPTPAKVRVRWAKKSGPGGVWFDAPHAVQTKAWFGAAGTYVLTCTADDGQATASADVTVAVAERTDGMDLATGLLHYWSLDGWANPHFIDPIGKRTDFTAPNYTTLCHVPGKVGYGARASAYSGTGAFWSTGAASGEVGQTQDAKGTAYSGNQPPVNDYLTISAWIYIDPEDANLKAGNIVGASVVGQSHTFGLRYNEKYQPKYAVNTDGFTLFQQGRGGNDASGAIGMCMVHFPAPNPSPKGRWMHICGILARNVADVTRWEMWYDGVKQTASSTYGTVRGRVNGSPLLIGGMNYTATDNGGGDYNANWAKNGKKSADPADYYSRTFPGIVDEVRMWTRKLTGEEIRYLAANPIVDANRGPSVDAPTCATARPVAKTPTQVACVAFADKLPTGEGLTYAWSVVSGDASRVTFGDATAATTTFTAAKKGTYIVQLAVTDGERTTVSKPLTLEVTKAGCVILLK